MKYRVEWREDGVDLEVVTDSLGHDWKVEASDGRNWQFRVRPVEDGTLIRMIIGDTAHTITVLPENRPGTPLRFLLDGRHTELTVLDTVDLITRSVDSDRKETGLIEVVSVMPGIVRSVMVGAGEEVVEGQPLMLLEAMKMENEIGAPIDGRVEKIEVAEGATVRAGDVLAIIEGN